MDAKKLEEGVKGKHSLSYCGPNIADTIINFRATEKNLYGNLKWHHDAPVWHNINIPIANRLWPVED